MIFADRVEAGERLAEALAGRAGASAVVLAIPRGGVVVGEVVARTIGALLDVVVPGRSAPPAIRSSGSAPSRRVCGSWMRG